MEMDIIVGFVVNEENCQFTSCIELTMSWVLIWYYYEFKKALGYDKFSMSWLWWLELNEYDFEWD